MLSLQVARVGVAVGVAVGDIVGDRVGDFDGATVPHTPLAHTWVVQSHLEVHIFPAPQLGHSGPPQSMSLSDPFLTPSWHCEIVGE